MASGRKSREPRRIITTVMLFIVLGAIVNAAVAWGCFAMNSQWRTELATLQATASFQVTPMTIPPPGSSSSSSFALMPGGPLLGGPVDGRTRLWYCEIILSGTSTASRASVRFGWPMLCVVTTEYEGRIDQLRQRPIAGASDLMQRAIWPGLAINTLFYAAILWLLLIGRNSFRRSSRLKRGLCPQCAYPIGESPLCTECGTAVKPALQR